MSRHLPFALDRDENLVDPSEGIEGAAYTCPYPRCPRPQLKFVAKYTRKGGPVRAYFAHREEACSRESEEHWRAKHLIRRVVRKRATGQGPSPLLLRKCAGCGRVLRADLPRSVTDAVVEKKQDEDRLTPDVTLLAGGQPVAHVEVYMTHPRRLGELRLPWLEVEAGAVLALPLRWMARQDALGDFVAERCGKCVRALAQSMQRTRARLLLHARDFCDVVESVAQSLGHAPERTVDVLGGVLTVTVRTDELRQIGFTATPWEDPDDEVVFLLALDGVSVPPDAPALWVKRTRQDSDPPEPSPPPDPDRGFSVVVGPGHPFALNFFVRSVLRGHVRMCRTMGGTVRSVVALALVRATCPACHRATRAFRFSRSPLGRTPCQEEVAGPKALVEVSDSQVREVLARHADRWRVRLAPDLYALACQCFECGALIDEGVLRLSTTLTRSGARLSDRVPVGPWRAGVPEPCIHWCVSEDGTCCEPSEVDGGER
ncbi:MAG TPA: hypothetical protein VFF73_10190 [Planctomycetota bacterium]|nr:hypothetical protein [Planctomycetota bacterium]